MVSAAGPANQRLTGTVPTASAGTRVDRALALMFPEYSRSAIKEWLKSGAARLDGRIVRPSEAVTGGEVVVIEVEPLADNTWRPQALSIEVLYEDDDLAVIDKPAGLVVHPGAGQHDGTLANALLHRFPAAAALPRAGIVHRLDKDTSGLLVVALSPRAQKHLVGQLQARAMTREYEAVVQGVPTGGGTIDAPIGRHPRERTRMATIAGGRDAITHFRVIERFRAHAHLRLRLETGRTHQIRVHLAHIGFPVVGDPEYGGRLKLPRGADAGLIAALRELRRQALHAARLKLMHPATGVAMEWLSPLPDDMRRLLAALAADRQHEH
jgi:23S rRNA pseudouridine1911/1915/1917 synthase